MKIDEEEIDEAHADWWDGYEEPFDNDWGCAVVSMCVIFVIILMICGL